MHKPYPDIETAEKIFAKGVEFRKTTPPLVQKSLYIEDEFIIHSHTVAKLAQIIASKTLYLNPEKAYVLGLLHDYGKVYDEKTENKSHGQMGYELMIEMGYPAVAKVCLTHTFPNKNFAESDFWYPKLWQNWIKKKLKDIEYDDYDKLIQLCDKFSEGKDIVSIEYRTEKLRKRYSLSDDVATLLLKEGMELKEYFDKVVGQNLYEVIGIK